MLRRVSSLWRFHARSMCTSPAFLGARGAPRTTDLRFEDGGSGTVHLPFPIYGIMDEAGSLVAPEQDPKVGEDTAVRMYETMVKLNVMDNYLYQAQRQNLISFYMTSFGEEATHIGTAAALSADDTVFAQYRETGVLMWRGFSIEDFTDQCTNNYKESGKGRQMPVHYGSKELNFQTISSPLATQIPQAAGAAYALKREGADKVVACYFGEGAASEGDFHAAMNFAATLDCPVLFFCRNNGYAISTPTEDQYRGDGIAARGIGYGMATTRVDGNDIWAVYNATVAARKLAVEESRPVLLELMTYRGGHHSTSDDSTRYRGKDEIDQWMTNGTPIARLRAYLEERGWWNDERDQQLREATKDEVLTCLDRSENQPKPALSNLFSDVYAEMPKHLQEQEREMFEHAHAHADTYNLGTFKQD